MSEYGIKIKIYQAGSIYEVEEGVRTGYDSKDAMLSNSLFSDFLREHGLNIWKGESTRDIICLEFNYGASSYEEAKNKLEKTGELELSRLEEIKDKFHKKTKESLREYYYENGVDIRYPTFDSSRHLSGYKKIHYRMLYRTPGKAKKGSCMFIRDSLYKEARNFLYMGIKLPKQNAPIVEIGAYSSLITSTIEARIHIPTESILILPDLDSKTVIDALSIEIDEKHRCQAIMREGYEVSNTMFDGQALIDESIFPDYADGYVLLRHHFTKCAAFCTRIQKYFQDYYKDNYETAKVKDMFGNEYYAKDIRLITTAQAVKWLKFNVSYEYWCDWVNQNGAMFGVVKTAHKSKLGDVQRMSYQMVNALSCDIMDDVLEKSKDYIWKLKTDNDTFFDFLSRNTNFSNDYDVLIALCKNDPEFVRSDYFRARKYKIISDYVKRIKCGQVIQNADNLVIVGSPYAMLMQAVGEDPELDPTFQCEDLAVQCYTGRFADGEYLAAFRSPFNSQNNLNYFHNCHHEYFTKYFNLGEQIIAVNMVHTSFQDRNNGSDQMVA